MKSQEILKHLAQRKLLKERQKQMASSLKALVKDYNKIGRILDAIEGVTIYNNHPIQILRFARCYEIRSASKENKRVVFVERYACSNKYCVKTIEHNKEVILLEEASKNKCLEYGKDYVTTGEHRHGQPRRPTAYSSR